MVQLLVMQSIPEPTSLLETFIVCILETISALTILLYRGVEMDPEMNVW